MKVRLLVLIGLTSVASPIYAQTEFSPPNLETFGSSISDEKYPNHFTIRETAKKTSDTEDSFFQNPQDLIPVAGQWLADQAAQLGSSLQISLIEFANHRSPFNRPRARYNRIAQFGTWARDPESCLNVRGKILQARSEVPVKTRPGADGCIVEQGRWTDPYSGNTYTKPFPNVEIDHMVPLKNAYLMGASKWSRQRRCWYANFYKNDFHLIPISATENEIKSDSTPYDYMPPQKNYLCQYVKNWLKVKLLWKLAMQPPEVEAIEKIIADNGCSKAQMSISKAELDQGRLEIEAGAPFCR